MTATYQTSAGRAKSRMGKNPVHGIEFMAADSTVCFAPLLPGRSVPVTTRVTDDSRRA